MIHIGALMYAIWNYVMKFGVGMDNSMCQIRKHRLYHKGYISHDPADE